MLGIGFTRCETVAHMNFLAEAYYVELRAFFEARSESDLY